MTSRNSSWPQPTARGRVPTRLRVSPPWTKGLGTEGTFRELVSSPTCNSTQAERLDGAVNGYAIAVTSPYWPRRTAKALAIRWEMVGMGTRSVAASRRITPSIAHASTRIVHRPARQKGRFEIVPKVDRT
jgi:hypothetical protein